MCSTTSDWINAYKRERECSGLGRGHKGSDFVILRRSIQAPTPVSPALKFVDDQNQNKKSFFSRKKVFRRANDFVHTGNF